MAHNNGCLETLTPVLDQGCFTIWPSSLLLFKELDDEVAYRQGPLHHDEMPCSLYDHQSPVGDSFCDATAAKALVAGVHGRVCGGLAFDHQGWRGDARQLRSQVNVLTGPSVIAI